jgi:hypothetical protein
MCTGIDYEVLENDEVPRNRRLFRKVFPNKDMRDYAIGRFANFISVTYLGRNSIFSPEADPTGIEDDRTIRSVFRGYCCKLPTSLLTQKRAAAGTP